MDYATSGIHFKASSRCRNSDGHPESKVKPKRGRWAKRAQIIIIFQLNRYKLLFES